MQHQTRRLVKGTPRFLALATLAAFTLSAVAQEVPQAERDALVQLYEATSGPEWRNNDGWLGEPGTECRWHGVTCDIIDDEWRVWELHLAYNGLQGELPQSLAALSQLAHLLLEGNRLGGQVPSDLWALESLESLALANNEFSGKIPDTLLELADSFLDLSDNRFTGYRITAEELQAGSDFTRLFLSGNHLESLPPEQWRRGVPVEELDLSDNRLSGELDASGLPPDLIELDLSRNDLSAVTGLASADTPALEILDLSHNRIASWPERLDLMAVRSLYLADNELTGPLPDWLSDLPLANLDLSDNLLSGDLPASFSDMQLEALVLSDNQFTGAIDTALAALSDEFHGGLWLHLSNNSFTGPLPGDFDATIFRHEHGFNTDINRIERFGLRGLDLCWNALDIPADAVDAINDVHRGGGIQSCIGRSRIAVGPTLSGSWYRPEHAGEGISQTVLDNGRVLTYWFTYGESVTPRRQRWFVSVSDPGERSRMVAPTGGRFSAGLPQGVRAGSWGGIWQRQTPLDSDTAHFSYDWIRGAICLTGFCSWQFRTGRYDQQRLTELAGTRCDNQSDFQQFSGAWYNPEHAGEGFIVEVLPDDRVVLYWFTYTPDGSGDQAWMIGDGAFEDLGGVIVTPPPDTEYTAELDIYQPTGARFGEDFDREEVEVIDWGTLTITFLEGGGGHVAWQSDLTAYGSGSYPIERLARPQLADCNAGSDQSR